jgi:hypothetical protein
MSLRSGERRASRKPWQWWRSGVNALAVREVGTLLPEGDTPRLILEVIAETGGVTQAMRANVRRVIRLHNAELDREAGRG